MIFLKQAEKEHCTQKGQKQLAGESAQDRICADAPNEAENQSQPQAGKPHIDFPHKADHNRGDKE